MPTDPATAATAPRTPGSDLLAAVAVMDRLRSPGGCPWDAEQTHRSLRAYLLEETYELLEAIDADDAVMIREELGDLLLQVLFHARVAQERRAGPAFDIDDVAADLVGKLTRRHPHVFGAITVDGAAQVATNWEQIKQAEKGRTSALDGVVTAQPALSLAAKMLTRTARAGLGPPTPAATGFGGRLLALAAEAVDAGVDPELALREALGDFAEQVRRQEASGSDKARRDERTSEP